MARDVPGLLESLIDFPVIPELASLYDYAIKEGLYIEGEGGSTGKWATWPQGILTEKAVLKWLNSVIPQLSAELARNHPAGRRIFANSTAAGLPLVDGDCLRKSTDSTSPDDPGPW